MKPVVLALAVAAMVGVLSHTASAHSEFKKALQEKYDFKSVSCNTCHVKGEKKSVRNEFGKAFVKEFESIKFDGKGITEKHDELKETGTQAEKDAFEEEMQKAFLKVLEDVKKKKDEETGKTWGELLEAGEIDGIKLK